MKLDLVALLLCTAIKKQSYAYDDDAEWHRAASPGENNHISKQFIRVITIKDNHTL